MKKLLLAVIGVACLLLNQSEARACSCELPLGDLTHKQQVKKARKHSQAVFAGEVVEILRPAETNIVIVKFRVEHSWKGKLEKEVALSTGRGGGDCGYQFRVGHTYLVYAYGFDETSLATNICQRTAALTDVAAEIKLLGKGKVPS